MKTKSVLKKLVNHLQNFYILQKTDIYCIKWLNYTKRALKTQTMKCTIVSIIAMKLTLNLTHIPITITITGKMLNRKITNLPRLLFYKKS